ncbi:MAG: ATP-binding protein, partial [Cyclobacteriaceae bacterium]|nr:ATP-binding protein [Cyclobacteriaceae bacterium]
EGGDLLFGIEEDSQTSAPKDIPGIEVNNEPDQKLRIEHIIRDGIEPRIVGFGVKYARLSNGKYVLIVRVPKSWSSPHWVKYRNHLKFYTRGIQGKYLMDISELRREFGLLGTITTSIKAFVTGRISLIQRAETSVPVNLGPKIILHLVPLSSFTTGQVYDLQEVFSKCNLLNPI